LLHSSQLLVRKLRSYRGDARFLTWLFTVTRNQALEGVRRKGRHERKMENLNAQTGDLHAVARICRETMASLIQPAEREGERVPGACFIYVLLGRTLVEWNELEQAEPLLIRGVELAEQFLQPSVQVDGCRALARLHCIQGHYREADAWMDKVQQACRRDPG